jgi:molecular chaperone DnaK (HSP70)
VDAEAAERSKQTPPASATFAVGIDLGTTNTVVASAPLDGSAGAEVFDVPQVVGAGEVESRPLLPSMLYAPLDGEHAPDLWNDAPWVLGAYARARAAEVAGRAVASSKSWLVHAGVDRTAAILPWGAPEDEGTSASTTKLSPVDAAARLLSHARRAWDAAHPHAPLSVQDVVLTVPASFDEVARELTVQAARLAGLHPKLLEEPQAAFYDWMARAGPKSLSALVDSLVLVVDIGGGTTDLSLVRVEGANRVARVAVGPHLLLGGDNMDLALAHAVEPRLAGGGKLDPARFAQLVGACRGAKERLLGDAPPGEVPVVVAGAGAKLVGGTRTALVTRDEAERIVLDGFLPVVAGDARPQRTRGALVAFGLPYERDVAITRHVAAFLARHLPSGWPDAVLLNGGVFRAARIAERIVECLVAWRGQGAVRRLPDADPDLAVARGAVAYALARRGRGVRIGGGAARGYFVAVAPAPHARKGAEPNADAPHARKGSEPSADAARAVCVVPRGAEEGVVHAAHGRTFALSTGRPVRFDVFASDEVDARAGDVVTVDDERFARLPPLATTVEGAAGAEVEVALEGELTAVGTLDLGCVETVAPGRRHRLAFQLQGGAAPEGPVSPSLPPRSSAPPSSARELVDRAFGRPRADASGREAKDLLRELERALGERSQWTTETSRALFDALLPDARARRRSADHERVFWLLAGWCIRPGFGDPLDPPRVASLALLFDERLAFPAEARGYQQFWIAWRRAAGGLDEAMQTKIRDFVDPWLAPPEAGLRKPKKPALSLDDALDMASSLERVAAPRRAELGGWVLERTWTDRDPRLWVALGRLGARVPAYASVHHVVAPYAVERWLDHLLREKWEAVPTAARSAVQLARRTGDRARDVGDRVRREVEQRLLAIGADPALVRAVRDVVPVEASERAAFFGESLPLGLRLVE